MAACRLSGVLAASLLLCLPAMGNAQPRFLKSSPHRPKTLQEVAGEIVWNPRRQGVLLIVAPQETHAKGAEPSPFDLPGASNTGNDTAEDEGKPQLPARDREGLRLSSLETYFDRKVIPCGDVTVLAPATMTVFNFKNLPKPSASAGMTPSDNFRLLQASLTEAQWRKLSSPAGLGYSDTSGTQRDLFLAALPRQITVRRKGSKKDIPVNNMQRQGIRMHVFHQLYWDIPIDENSFHSGRGNDAADPEPSLTINDQTRSDKVEWKRQAFGVSVVREVPTYAKPGHLPFGDAAFDAVVPLDEIKTLGDLVERVRAVTHVEVYADARYARLPLLLRGEQARAGNLLKACARAVSGTYRSVGPAYVLTDDITGLAERHLRVYDWIQANRKLAVEAEARIHRVFKETQPDNFIGYDPADPLAPSEEVQNRYRAYENERRRRRKEYGSTGNLEIRVSSSMLPVKAQEMLRTEIADLHKEDDPSSKAVTGDTVILNQLTRMTWSIPGIGLALAPYEGDATDSDFEDALPPFTPYPVPASLTVRAVFIGSGSTEQTNNILPAAKRAGFNEIWLEANPTRLEMLEPVIQQAKQNGLAIRAVVRGGRTKKADRASRATNVLGETFTEYLTRIEGTTSPENLNPLTLLEQQRGDWLEPEAPECEEAVTQAVKTLTQVPGLAGVVVSDMIPPGFGPPSRRAEYPAKPEYPGLQSGYSMPRRLSYLRRYRTDPVDVPMVGLFGFDTGVGPYRTTTLPQLELPFWENRGAEWQQLQNEKYSSAEAALTRLQTRLGNTPVPVWFYKNYLDAPEAAAYVGNRDKPLATASEPDKEPNESGNVRRVWLPPTASQRAHSSTLLMAADSVFLARYFRDRNKDWFLTAISYLFSPANDTLRQWDGIVLDTTRESLPEALEHLRQLPPIPEKP